MPSNEVSLTVDFKNVKLVQEIIKKFTDEATRLEERNGILYSHIELLNKALDVLCPLVARTIDFLPSEQFTLRAATREALDNVTYIQNKEYRENTNPDYYKEEENKSRLVYIVTMYRYGDREKHSYVLGAFSTENDARECGEKEKDYRGGKYEPEIIKFYVDSQRIDDFVGDSDHEHDDRIL